MSYIVHYDEGVAAQIASQMPCNLVVIDEATLTTCVAVIAKWESEGVPVAIYEYAKCFANTRAYELELPLPFNDRGRLR